MSTLREASKRDWNSNDNIDNIAGGSLQRIADACELMASSWNQLKEDRDLYQRWYREANTEKEKLQRQNAALRSVITKLKRKEDVGQPKQNNHGIAWTDRTWNPIRGCSRVSPGCTHCYAEKMAARFSGEGQPFHLYADREKTDVGKIYDDPALRHVKMDFPGTYFSPDGCECGPLPNVHLGVSVENQ